MLQFLVLFTMGITDSVSKCNMEQMKHTVAFLLLHFDHKTGAIVGLVIHYKMFTG